MFEWMVYVTGSCFFGIMEKRHSHEPLDIHGRTPPSFKVGEYHSV
jgi:hypothetical protein